MRKYAVAILLVTAGAGLVFAMDSKQRQEFHLSGRRPGMMLVAPETAAPALSAVVGRSASVRARGPGKVLMESFFDYGSNGGVLANLYDYGDGTLAVGRMGAAEPALGDRGTFFSFFDGSVWSPMTKVEHMRRGWSNINALQDGRSVIVSQSGNEVNIDTARGTAVWTSTLTEGATAAAVQWPRFLVDAQDNIIVCSTTFATVNGVSLIKQVNLSRDQGKSWQHAFLWPDTSTRKPAFSADDQALASFGNNIAIAVCETGGDTHLWTSTDNGEHWAYRNLTHYPQTLPEGTEGWRGAGAIEAVYDRAGRLHLFWENYLVRPEAMGTGLEFYESTDDPILHWSEESGITPVVRFADIPAAAEDSLVFSAGSSLEQIDADGGLLKQPQAGVTAAGNLYLLFATFRPNDVDQQGAHFTDLYAAGSRDGGATWGAPVEVTASPQTEDLWASLAHNLGDSLRFVYQSDGDTGNSFLGGGSAPTTFLYDAFPIAAIPLQPTAVTSPATEISTDYILEQNYPNPFNPTTEIFFAVDHAQQVRLQVYNARGQEVATLFQGLLAAGRHRATWHAQDLPTGIYFVQFSGAHFDRVRKMLLVK